MKIEWCDGSVSCECPSCYVSPDETEARALQAFVESFGLVKRGSAAEVIESIMALQADGEE